MRHVGPHTEFQRHLRFAGARAGGHDFKAVQTPQRFFLRVDDLALDLGGRGTRPVRANHDNRFADVGCKLNGNAAYGDQPEKHSHYDRCNNCDRAFDCKTNEIHVPCP